MRETTHATYLIALGSNRRHHRIGPPERVLEAAMAALAAQDIDILALAPPIRSRPIGPSQRLYANSAALIRSALAPDALLALLKTLEARFGTRRGQRWSARTLDLDIIWWSGGTWHSRHPELIIPHLAFRERRFVLQPAAVIAPRLRDPVSGRSVAQLLYRLTRA
ncbi:2-amino-4-hydroxy-6-hydroxymethyldihydropteridine diphosphokinase [Blastomonas sp.]|uniref:2-amino-4-hydroxy-6- hydroxymethyldihydropteridine diphosphokinase n=1 Tax=Blastomonas sp. TaxID=1909299 RepID=UPI00261C28D4|nr:2-amino-4-hydroxy-6-hydroxymethyldihydropteridine diphosphokinase [Blastomonas sp.]MDM7956247.1 2-amino-4-hydroxy-6-hydroxymethyldihydropteridine diphosphokinase [Blastomonas sp.]